MTYLLIPSYGARDLEDPDGYLCLDHECFRPSAETVQYMRQTLQAKSAPYTMVEIIDRADNYGLQVNHVSDNISGRDDYDQEY